MVWRSCAGCCCSIWFAASACSPMSASRSRFTTRNRSGGWRVRAAPSWAWSGITRCPGCSSGATDEFAMSQNEGRLVRNTVLTILALVALRLIAAALTPLTFDEAYYWMWSQHLALGYYDHPPMVAVVIRL